MDKKRISIAIDGPSGAGKSTLARFCAERFKLMYVDTGALYRTIGLSAYRASIDSKDQAGVTALLPALLVELKYDEAGVQRMFLNGEDVSNDIRMPPVSIYASDVSAMPPVREFLLEMQRDLARRYDVIMDGRDIGTVVLPDASLKIFLTASLDERAHRRYEELKSMGVETSFEAVYKDIEYRDINDSSRAQAPLRAAEGAVFLDTTGNTLEQSIELLCSVIAENLKI